LLIHELIVEQFLGTCVDAFDDDGDCIGPGLYKDVTDFAQHEEKAMPISENEFYSNMHIPNYLEKHISKNRKYLVDGNIYIVYDVDSDIHYFFKKL
jgi:hypothetical protein